MIEFLLSIVLPMGFGLALTSLIARRFGDEVV